MRWFLDLTWASSIRGVMLLRGASSGTGLKQIIFCAETPYPLVTMFQWEQGTPCGGLSTYFITRKPACWNRNDLKMKRCKTGCTWVLTTFESFPQCFLFISHSAVVANRDTHYKSLLWHTSIKKLLKLCTPLVAVLSAPGEGSVWLVHAISLSLSSNGSCSALIC